jgi:cell division transport system permease protein
MPRRKPAHRPRRRSGLPAIRPPKLESWARNHGEVAVETLRRLLQAPLGTLMTASAVAIALALPAALFVVLDNLQALGGDWRDHAAISVFMEATLDEVEAASVVDRLQQRPEIVSVELISRADALAEFRAYSGLTGALDQLVENPLPVVLQLEVQPSALEAPALSQLIAALDALPQVDFVREDAQWVQRFQAIVALLRMGIAMLSILLGLGVLLVVGNTIRLEIENRRDEIRILCLIGATASFARRRFLYSGAWYGLFGGLLAWLLVSAMVWLLERQSRGLAALYHTELDLQGLGVAEVSVLMSVSALLGVVGSWIAVGRHLGVEDTA